MNIAKGIKGFIKIPLSQRLWSKIKLQSNDCWHWTGAINKEGYGIIRREKHGKWYCDRVHRFVYELVKGKIPYGLELDHLCRNPICCNPRHLEPVTHAENVRRGNAKNIRSYCKLGHPFNENNTYINNQGIRLCVECKAERQRRYRRSLRQNK